VSLGGAESPLGCAVLALGSDNDPRVPAEETQEWGRYTSGPFDHRVFAGGHFFLKTSHADVTAYIASIALTGPPRTASTGLIMYDPNADK
jgi:surfactin synthase thioesterase subunit